MNQYLIPLGRQIAYKYVDTNIYYNILNFSIKLHSYSQVTNKYEILNSSY